MKEQQQICIAIVQDKQGQYLICQRQEGQHLAGKWEFPGGKVEPGETLEQTLLRELQEEVGLVADSYQTFHSLSFDYDDLALQLHFYLVTEFTGQAKALEGQNMLWVALSELENYPFPKANKTIINKLLEHV